MYDKARDHRRASGFSTPLLVSMETRTETFRHKGAAIRHEGENMRLKHASGISDISTPTGIKVLFTYHKF